MISQHWSHDSLLVKTSASATFSAVKLPSPCPNDIPTTLFPPQTPNTAQPVRRLNCKFPDPAQGSVVLSAHTTSLSAVFSALGELDGEARAPWLQSLCQVTGFWVLPGSGVLCLCDTLSDHCARCHVQCKLLSSQCYHFFPLYSIYIPHLPFKFRCSLKALRVNIYSFTNRKHFSLSK